jgi:hypothetical protein
MFVLLLAAPFAAAQQQPVLPEDIINGSQVMTSQGNLLHATLREDCRSMLVDSLGRMWTVGIQSDGSEELNTTRQFLSIGLFEDAHWTAKARLTESGYTFFPAAVPDKRGGLWISWTQFDERARNWRVHAAYFDGEHWSHSSAIDQEPGPELRSSIVVEADERPLIVYESAENHHFVLRAAKYSDGRWTTMTLTTADYNFRPVLALDRQGKTWLAWDRFTDGDYDVLVRPRANGVWGKEILFFASAEDEQRPSLQLDPDGTLWVLAGKRLAGVRNGRRAELASPLHEPADQFLIDSAGRFWFFRSLVRTLDESIDYITRRGGRVSITLLAGKSPYQQTFEIGLGYRPPFLDSRGDLWNTADSVIYRIHQGLPPAGKGNLDVRIVGPLDEARHSP